MRGSHAWSAYLVSVVASIATTIAIYVAGAASFGAFDRTVGRCDLDVRFIAADARFASAEHRGMHQCFSCNRNRRDAEATSDRGRHRPGDCNALQASRHRSGGRDRVLDDLVGRVVETVR